jgi:hypothetical protein
MMLRPDVNVSRSVCRDDVEPRWSARRTLAFLMLSNLTAWWLIASALRAL